MNQSFIQAYIFAGIFVIIMVIWFIYVYTTPFERNITVKEKYSYASGSGKYMSIENTIMDSESRLYSVTNCLPLFHFTAAEVLATIEKGKAYAVVGYGRRIPILGLYPNIVKLK